MAVTWRMGEFGIVGVVVMLCRCGSGIESQDPCLLWTKFRPKYRQPRAL